MLIILPTITGIVAAIMTLFLWARFDWQRWVSLCACGLYFLFSLLLFLRVYYVGDIVLHVGGWPAPFGISLCADLLSVLMLLLTAIVAFVSVIFSFFDIEKVDIKSGFYPSFMLLLVGLSGAFLTADLFNLYVWFELILICSFILLVLRGGKFQLEACVKYAVLSLIATMFLLIGIAFLYSQTGTLNMADLAVKIQQTQHVGFLRVIAVLLVIAFGMKAAIFPLYFWLPAAYHTTRYTSSSFFSALLTKVGVYALIRLFTLLFPARFAFAHELLLLLAIITLLIGVMGALAYYKMRQILSFLLISHIGYMLLGVALMNVMALTGAIDYMLQHVLVIALLFMLAGLIKYYLSQGSTISLYRKQPILALLFFIAILSLSGVPPFSGFWPKLVLIKGLVLGGFGWMAIVVLWVSMMTLYVLLRLWHHIFLRVPESASVKTEHLSHPVAAWLPIAILSALVLILSFSPNMFYVFSHKASLTLIYPNAYLQSVLGVLQ